ncbi:MAG: transketolase [Nitrospirae bacterium]|nr:transketolase [Nitrospirota bacterium]
MDEARKIDIQRKLRLDLIELHYIAHAGHIGASLSCMDIMIHIMLFEMGCNDYFILSKGHAAAALYTILHYKKLISDEELASFYKDGTTLPAHPPAISKSYIPFATGSLGHGLSIAAGMALHKKLGKDTSDYRVFCLLSDGECNEGAVWEAVLFSVKHKLENLIIMIDRNGLQGFDKTEGVTDDGVSASKWKAFGCDVYQCDGHNLEDMASVFLNIKANSAPIVVIFNTIKGKGIGYMEGKLEWHYLPMDDIQYATAIKEIREKYSA